MSTGFDALRDHEVTPGLRRRHGFRPRPHLPTCKRAALVDSLHQRGVGIAVEKVNNTRVFNRNVDEDDIAEEWDEEINAIDASGSPVHVAESGSQFILRPAFYA